MNCRRQYDIDDGTFGSSNVAKIVARILRENPDIVRSTGRLITNFASLCSELEGSPLSKEMKYFVLNSLRLKLANIEFHPIVNTFAKNLIQTNIKLTQTKIEHEFSKKSKRNKI